MAKQKPQPAVPEPKREPKREFRCCHRYARISPRKVRLVMDLVRGLPVERALDDLRFSTKRATPMIRKVIRSALANATQEAGLETSTLFISQALVDVGPTVKRFKPRAMGRAYPRLRRTCHISVVLREMTPKELEQKKQRIKKPRQKKGQVPGGDAAPAETKSGGATTGKEKAS